MTQPPSEPSPSMMVSPVAASIAFAFSKGIPMETLTEATGLSLGDILDPDSRLPGEAMSAVWRLLGEAFPDEPLALEMAAAAPLSFFGDFTRAAKSAKDIKAVLETIVAYQSVFATQATIALVEEDSQVIVTLSHPLDHADRGYSGEVAMAMGVRLFRDVFNIADALQGVELMRPPPSSTRAHEAFFAIPIRFACPRNALFFHPDALTQPLHRFDPAQFRAIQGHLQRVQAELSREDEHLFLTDVRQALTEIALKRDYRATSLAKELGMGMRTLQRRLSESGTSVRSLIAEVREANARQLLTDPSLTIEDISQVLDYSTVAAFHRAFQRWTGESPGSHRRRLTRGLDP